MHTNRNEEICRLYMSGSTVKDCSQKFGISHERVRQILRKAGVFTPAQREKTSNRDEFLGINLTEGDKIALRAEAAKRGLSMSALTSDLIRDMLATLPKDTTT